MKLFGESRTEKSESVFHFFSSVFWNLRFIPNEKLFRKDWQTLNWNFLEKACFSYWNPHTKMKKVWRKFSEGLEFGISWILPSFLDFPSSKVSLFSSQKPKKKFSSKKISIKKLSNIFFPPRILPSKEIFDVCSELTKFFGVSILIWIG